MKLKTFALIVVLAALAGSNFYVFHRLKQVESILLDLGRIIMLHNAMMAKSTAISGVLLNNAVVHEEKAEEKEEPKEILPEFKENM